MADTEPKVLSIAQQAARSSGEIMYDMTMKFDCDTSLSETDNFMARMGFESGPILPSSMAIKIRQVVPFVPDDKMLEKYAAALIGATRGMLVVKKAKFAGYESFHAVEPIPKEDNDHANA